MRTLAANSGQTEEQPSTSTQTTAAPTARTAANVGDYRRSLYQSLPLYWHKGWRTHAPLPAAPSSSNGHQQPLTSSSNKHSLASLPSKPKPTRPGQRRKGGEGESRTDLTRRPLLEQTMPPMNKTQHKGAKSQRRFSQSADALWPKRQIRHGRLILLALISGSCLLLLLSLSLILGPHFFPTKSRPRIEETNSMELGRLRTAYSEVHPLEEQQIWLLNTHEFRRRQKRRAFAPRDPFLFGLAHLCGQTCSVRLKHGIGGGRQQQQRHEEMLRIRLTRRMVEQNNGEEEGKRQRRSIMLPERPISSGGNTFTSFLPLVQTMESANQTQIRRSHISPDCFYSAQVENAEQQSVVNLCDRNGGLFGTLALGEGAFLIEPLIMMEKEEIKGNGRRRKRMISRGGGGTAQLRAHLIYPVQRQHFGDDQQQQRIRRGRGRGEEMDGDGWNWTNSGEEGREGGNSSSEEEGDEEGMAKKLRFWMDQQRREDGQQNETDWGEHEASSQSPPPPPRLRRSTASANSWDHHVEVLVVADHRMLLYHGQNLENYVLTLFSTVASIYRHPSLGVSVSVIVVRLVILKNERAGPLVSNRAQETLQQFCQWQQLYNDRNDESLNHHDVAILLTRHDICRAVNKCDTLGLAELGTMCDAKRSCAIIEDNGLSAAFTIAHELGHIFNIPHDDERKCAEFMPLNKANYHIMAPTLEYNTNPWSWSACSSAMLIRFLDTRRGQTQCILDQPVERRYYEKMFETPAPGAIYSVSQQCKFVFGAGAEICPYMPSCRRLWCSVAYGYQLGCRTQHMPWADGTECGHQMWCYRGQCVGMSPEQRQPVDGGWGEWKAWHQCSRSCGGGVQKAYRDCDSPRPENGGKYCTGQRVRYRPCSLVECPWEMPGFREQQCADFDGKDIGIHGVPKETRWVPKYTGVAENERCKLLCRAADSAAFYLLSEKAIDGTACDRHGDDMCIDGACHKAGCDHRLGSDMKRDICGVCGGDGRSCREVKGIYNDLGTFGYNEVLRIPAGAANIDISQRAHNGQSEDDNYLALRMANGEWLLNGQYQVSVFRQQIPVLDTVLEYSGSETAMERINGTGPLRSDVYLHVLSVGNLKQAPNIHYRFMDPIGGGGGGGGGGQFQQQRAATASAPEQQSVVAPPQAPGSFYWRQLDQWSECSLKCQGTQTQLLVCTDAVVSNRPIPDGHCDAAHIRRPDPQKRLCNVDCFYKWQQRLNADSTGRRWYEHICVRSFTNGGEEQAGEGECQRAGVPAPTRPTQVQQQPQESPREAAPSTQQQNGQKQQQQITDRRWAYSEWSQCSETCGSGGIRRRSLHCIDTRNGHKLDGRFCEGIAHESVQTECNRTPCPRWAHGPWSECSRSCGTGVRMRHAACQDGAGRELNAAMCSADGKKDSEKCNEQGCSQWRFGEWTKCSVSCGQGVERREARCVDADGRPLEESACNVREKIVEKQCELAPCPQWQLGSWSQCSASCGSDGFQTRLVQCHDSAGRKLADQFCHQKSGNGELRPQSHKVCSPGPCPYWRTADWGKCSVSCGQGMRARRVECVSRDQLVDDSLCAEPNRPPTHERCVLLACAFWKPEAWEPCSVSCGWGVQKRAVNCVRQTSGGAGTNRSIVVHDKECPGQKPRSERSCESQACPSSLLNGGAHWEIGPWMEECSACANGTDGGGTQKRIVECRNAQRLLPGPFCSNLERPPDSRPCTCQPQQPKSAAAVVGMEQKGMAENMSGAISPAKQEIGKWEIGAWSPCSLSCGGGWRRRSVFCKNALSSAMAPTTAINAAPSKSATGNVATTASNSAGCPEAEKPIQFEQCHKEACPTAGQWHFGAWSPCSVTCGQGEQSRPVWCNSGTTGNLMEKKKMEEECGEEGKPAGKRTCSRGECPIVPPAKLLANDGKKEVADKNKHETASQLAGAQKTSTQPTSSSFSSSASASIESKEALSPALSPASSGRPGIDEFVSSSSSFSSQKSAPSSHPRWQSGPWSACPRHCGSTVRTRHIHCVDPASGHPMSPEKCPENVRPPAEQRCRQTNCPRWHKANWGLCSTSCGPGVARRDVFCGKGRGVPERVPDAECMALGPKPFETRKCEPGRCPSYSWRVGSWSKCVDPCKPSEQRRRVYCISEHGKRAATKMCLSDGETNGTNTAGEIQIQQQPAETRKCPTDKCPYHWVAGAWSTCSRTCGAGFHFRRIECKVRREMHQQRQKNANAGNNSSTPPMAAGSEPTVLSRMCMALEKPIVTKQCSMNPCDAQFHWSVGPWSQCSKSCGPGFRRRKVRCLDRTEGRVDREKCDQKNRPRRRESCFQRNCLPSDCAELRAQQERNGNGRMLDGNYTVLVTGFRIEVYCHLMNETIPKTYLNVQPESNFAEFYGKRLVYPYSCPHDGRRNNSCACSNDGHVGQGLSKFRKIRVDLHNMKINPNDHAFARTEYGSPVAYGTAGDCYSMSDCPQGHFSIDLRGTGLRLVDDLQWTDQGHRTSSRIERSENNALVQGYCGGYCGECAPDRFKGLVLEVDQRQSPIVGIG